MTIKTHMELMTHDDNHIFVNPLYPAYTIQNTLHKTHCLLYVELILRFGLLYAYLLIVL